MLSVYHDRTCLLLECDILSQMQPERGHIDTYQSGARHTLVRKIHSSPVPVYWDNDSSPNKWPTPDINILYCASKHAEYDQK